MQARNCKRWYDEKQAKDAGYELKVGKFPFSAMEKLVLLGKRWFVSNF